MKRANLIGAALLVSACAQLQGITGDLGEAAKRSAEQSGKTLVQSGGKGVREFAEKAKRCGEFGKRAVPYEEEVQIGGAVALALADQTNGVFVEIAPSLVSKTSLNPSELKYQKPSPASGPRTNLHFYVARLGKGLAAFSPRPDIDWTFVVLDSTTANAFSAPGGYVFITTALLSKMDNEAQLAGVLAHEIGHVTSRHALKAYAQSKTDTCNWALGGSVLSGFVKTFSEEAMKGIGQSWATALDLPKFDLDGMTNEFVYSLTMKLAEGIGKNGNSKEDEYDADKTAFELMLFSGYDYREYEKLLRGLPEGGGTFSNHPKNADRVAAIEKTRTGQYADFATESLKTPPKAKELDALKK